MMNDNNEMAVAKSNQETFEAYKLCAANDSEIPTFGHKILTLNLRLRREFQFPFIIAKVDKGIIGADFLNKFNLLIDIRNKQLIDGITNLHVNGEISSILQENKINIMDKTSKFSNILLQYSDLMKPNLLVIYTKHDVKHYIATKGPPVYSKACQLDSKKLEIAKQEFKFMINNDIIRPSKSPWASPLHLVNKKDGSVRPCGDYRRLNAQTIPDRYPIPRIQDFHHILKGKIFCRPRRLAPERMKIAKAEFEAMMLEGTARGGEGSWASPLHLVPKKSEGWHPCGDYRALNVHKIPDCYPVRHIHDYSHRLQDRNIFYVIDLAKVYTQVPVNEEDIPKLFEFPFMSFGLRNAGQTFQRFIDGVP
ncbi:transposon Ty3-G Gag-Pol polyprotein [Trichonephila clavipes]|nr:transposon Ty3-G Gag-Pol polyprotein [Trichonephila clavipes]